MKAYIHCQQCGDRHKLRDDKFLIEVTDIINNQEVTTGFICEKCAIKIYSKTNKELYKTIIEKKANKRLKTHPIKFGQQPFKTDELDKIDIEKEVEQIQKKQSKLTANLRRRVLLRSIFNKQKKEESCSETVPTLSTDIQSQSSKPSELEQKTISENIVPSPLNSTP